jgi:hypothetical protein
MFDGPYVEGVMNHALQLPVAPRSAGRPSQVCPWAWTGMLGEKDRWQKGPEATSLAGACGQLGVGTESWGTAPLNRSMDERVDDCELQATNLRPS